MPTIQQLASKLIDATRLQPSVTGAPTQLLSPFASTPTSALQRVVWSDIFDQAPKIVTRGEAMAVPAVAKARNLLVGLLAGKPLVALEAGSDVPMDEQPAWLQSSSNGVSPQHRMAWTIDDLIFAGVSLWVLDREGDAPDGAIVEATRWPLDQWEIDQDNRVLVSGTPMPAHQLLIFTGFGEGLLQYATRTMQGAQLLESAWVRRANDPIPVMDLHMTHEDALSDEDAKELAEAWDLARRNGATAVTPAGIDARALGTVSPDLFVEGRNALRLDVAGFFNLPGSLLDASTATASLTYSTQEGSQNELATISVPYWTDPIASRLSLDDVVPEGVRVRFDLSELHTLPTKPTGTTTED